MQANVILTLAPFAFAITLSSAFAALLYATKKLHPHKSAYIYYHITFCLSSFFSSIIKIHRLFCTVIFQNLRSDIQPPKNTPLFQPFLPVLPASELRLLPRHPDSWHFEAAHTLGLMALRVVFSPRKFTCPVRQYPYTRIMSAAASVFFLCFALFRAPAAIFPFAKKTARFPTDGRSFLKSPVLPFIELEHSRYCSYHNVYIGIRGIRAHIVIELIPPFESRIKLIILSPRFIYCLYLLH